MKINTYFNKFKLIVIKCIKLNVYRSLIELCCRLEIPFVYPEFLIIDASIQNIMRPSQFLNIVANLELQYVRSIEPIVQSQAPRVLRSRNKRTIENTEKEIAVSDSKKSKVETPITHEKKRQKKKVGLALSDD